MLKCKICSYEWVPKRGRIPSKCPNCRAQIYGTTNYENVGCFIATVIYGSETSPQVTTLRRFRDENLLTNKLGIVFVRLYYRISPTIADLLKPHKIFCDYSRKILDAVVILVGNK